MKLHVRKLADVLQLIFNIDGNECNIIEWTYERIKYYRASHN